MGRGVFDGFHVVVAVFVQQSSGFQGKRDLTVNSPGFYGLLSISSDQCWCFKENVKRHQTK